MKFEDVKGPVRLNVCSGRHVLDGWVNVDVVVSNHPKAKGPPDILADMRSIPLPDSSVDELQIIHGIEHVVIWEAEKALLEFKRLLKPGGLLVIECPDLIKCCQNIISGFTLPNKHPDQYGLWGLFGDDRPKDEYMTHRYAYSPASLSALLTKVGFEQIREDMPQWHSAGKNLRDMRMTCIRPNRG